MQLVLVELSWADLITRMVVKPNGLCTRRSGVRATALARVFRISRGLSRYSPMSEVFAPRYLAGLVSTHG